VKREPDLGYRAVIAEFADCHAVFVLDRRSLHGALEIFNVHEALARCLLHLVEHAGHMVPYAGMFCSSH